MKENFGEGERSVCAGVGGVRAEVTIKGEHKGGFWGDGLVCIQIIVVVTQIYTCVKIFRMDTTHPPENSQFYCVITYKLNGKKNWKTVDIWSDWAGN